MFLRIPKVIPHWMRPTYLLLSTILGLLVSFGIHALLEMWYLNIAVSQGKAIVWYRNFGVGQCALPPVLAYSLLAFGLLGGFAVGRIWWRWVYIERKWEQKNITASHRQSIDSYPGGSYMKNFYALAGAIIIIAAVGIAGYFILQKEKPKTSPAAPKVLLTQTTAQAFGTLSTSFVSATDIKTRNAAPTAEQTAGTLPAGVAPVPVPMPPDAVRYRYTYNGEPLQLPDTTLDVFERRIGNAAAASSELLRSVGYGSLDLSTFGPLDVQSLSLGKDDGYVINLNGQDGSINIYKNSGVNELVRVKSTSDIEANPLPVLADRLINIANSFLRDHGIDDALYGTPREATNGLTVMASEPANGITYPNGVTYFGGQQTVIYPFRLNNLSVYGLWGEDIGLIVIVDSTTQTVMSVNGLTTHEYLRSEYPAVTDPATILAVAERGGLYNAKIGSEEKVVDIQLDAPDRVLAQMFRYDSSKSRDLLVPALRFSVLNPPDGAVKAIVIPLVKDLLKVDQAVIEPVLLEGLTGSSGSGTTGTATVPAPSE